MTSPINALLASPASSTPTKAAAIGKDFEALLVAQMLKSAHGAGSGWLSSGEDQSMEAAIGFAEEHLSRAFTAGGGFGLSKLIDSHLK